ncbi:MAG: esterase-like activity of phytase family protein [Anaerolineae bacterium]|nr:esterase-like activity of phytase family protein [Anaerolineae bacterium]
MLIRQTKWTFFGIAVAITIGSAALAQEATGTITATYTLPEITIADAQNAVLPDSITNDRKLLLGGTGSDLWHGATDAADEFWMITDRGPNGQISVEDKNRRTFPIPEFTPLILHVKVEGDAITVLETLPIVNGEGNAVTGLSNLADHDEKPWDYAAAEELTFDQDGLDSEGIVRTTAGDFWLVEEYGPSIVKVNAQGQVVKRFVPEGLVYDAATYEVVDTLPAILATRRGNRGFEGIALSADEKTLYAAVQSPLRNPDADTGDNSASVRIIAFDLTTETVTGEYIYVLQDPAEFGFEGEPGEMKISGLIAYGDQGLLVLERTDPVAKVYLADFSSATNIAGTAWDDAATAPGIEALSDLAASEVVPMTKTLVVDLDTIDGVPDKIEGIALLDNETLVIANDNDFAIGDFDAEGNNISTGVASQILFIKLATPLE